VATASVLLHFGYRDLYPILDFRALWSLSVEPPKEGYDFEFWSAYTTHCRELARQAEVDMRTLDRALWQYSSDNQKTIRRSRAFPRPSRVQPRARGSRPVNHRTRCCG